MIKFLNNVGRWIGMLASIAAIVGIFLPFYTLGDRRVVSYSVSLYNYSETGLIIVLVVSLLCFLLFYKGFGFLQFILGIGLFVMNIIMYFKNPVSSLSSDLDSIIPVSGMVDSVLKPGIGMLTIAISSALFVIASAMIRLEKKEKTVIEPKPDRKGADNEQTS